MGFFPRHGAILEPDYDVNPLGITFRTSSKRALRLHDCSYIAIRVIYKFDLNHDKLLGRCLKCSHTMWIARRTLLKEFLLYLFEQRQLFESVIATNQHLFFIVASSLLLAKKRGKVCVLLLLRVLVQTFYESN